MQTFNNFSNNLASSMISSRSSTRQRSSFRWNRFINDKKALDAVVVKETPNMNLLRMVRDMYSDNRIVSRNLSDINAYVESMNGGPRSVKFEQKTLDFSATPDYLGANSIGRSYTSSRLVYLPRLVLNTIYKRTHVELDIQNSFPSLLSVFASEVFGLTIIKEYAQNPDYVLKNHLPGLPRSILKKSILTFICSHPQRVYTDDPTDTELIRQLSECKFFDDLFDDLVKIGKFVRNEYPLFYSAIANNPKTKREHLEGTLFHYICADIENYIMRKVIAKLPEDIVWLFDGVIMPSVDNTEDFCDVMSRYIRDQCGIDISFHIKSLHENSLPICLPEVEVTGDAYTIWKREFEKDYMKLRNPPCFYSFSLKRELNDTDFRHLTAEQPQDFISKWRVDKGKRQYIARAFLPPPRVCSPEYFNTYVGIAAEKMETVPDDFNIYPYIRHVRILMGGNDDYALYFHKLIAYKIRNPGLIWRVMPLIRSCPGVGKDLWFTFMTKIFGEELCHRAPKISDLVGNETHCREAKLLIAISEMDFRDSIKIMEDTKDLITSEQMRVKKKYVSEYTIETAACLIGFTNHFCSIKVKPDDRRFFCVEADGMYAMNKDYIKQLLEFMECPEAPRAVYQFYMDNDAINLDGFDPSGDRPRTETYSEMVKSSESLMDYFFKRSWKNWKQYAADDYADYKMVSPGVLRIRGACLYDEFYLLVKEQKVSNVDSRHKAVCLAVRHLGELKSRTRRYLSVESLPDTITFSRTNKVRYINIDVVAIERYITEMLMTSLDDLDDDDGDENAMLIDAQP